MSDQNINNIAEYLTKHSPKKWVTSQTLIKKLNIQDINNLELDELLISYFQNTEHPRIRCSNLPSKKNLDVLWGSVERVKSRHVDGIYNQNENILVDDLERIEHKNMFLSHSFKDLGLAIGLSKALAKNEIYTWLAESEILRYDHINYSVQNAIQDMPYFGVLITENLFSSVWSAKEVGFGLQGNKQIIGFIDATSDIVMNKITEKNIDQGNAISREIYDRFFDKHPNVDFLLFPEKSKLWTDEVKENYQIENWNILKPNNTNNFKNKIL